MSENKHDDAAKKAAEEAVAAKVAKKARADTVDAAPPAWQGADYAGALDCEQAAWRNKHIKPARDVSTK